MSAARALVGAAHPGPALAVTVLAALLAVRAGTGPATGVLVVAAVLTGQLSIGWSNDLVDPARDRAVGRADKPLATGAVGERDRARGLRGRRPADRRRCPSPAGSLAGLVHLVCVAAGWAYNLGAKSTAWSWLPYAVAFGLLPVFVDLAAAPTARPATPPWVVAGGALLGVGAHLVNVLPDLADDAATGVRGLPHRLGATRTRLLAVAVLVLATVVILVGAPRRRAGAGVGGRAARSRRSPGSPWWAAGRRRSGPRSGSRWSTSSCWCGRGDGPDPAGAGTDWDLVVVGAGPAGSAAALGALRADPALRVLLLDRADFPRDKSCGDGIAPHVFDVLREVGAGDVVDGWAPLRRLELSPRRPPRRARRGRRMARPIWVMPARGLRRPAGRAGRRRRRRAAPPAGRRVTVADGPGGARRRHHAPGRWSARTARTPSSGPRWASPRAARRALAIRGYAPTRPDWRGRQVIRYGDRRQPAYAWAFDRGDGLSNVGLRRAASAPDAARPGRCCSSSSSSCCPGTAATPDVRWRGHHLPLSGRRWDQPDGPVLLVGDAAGLVNPMTGEGIYYAVATGVLAGRGAARALAEGSPATAGAAHRRAVRRLLGRHLRHTSVAARLSEHPAVVDAGIRAAGRSRPAFDELVELGLGRGRITPRLAGGLAAGLPPTGPRLVAAAPRPIPTRRPHPTAPPTHR